MRIADILKERVLVLDGGLGTQIQSFGLNEADFRGERFKDSSIDLVGCNDILSITKPDVIASIHKSYLAAGADIITTNSFNSTMTSMADYGLTDIVYELNRASAQLARSVVDEFGCPLRKRFVAGSVGPTSKTLSICADVNDPQHRDLSFDELLSDYMIQIGGLVDGGVDIILMETIFDTLNAKAAIEAFRVVTSQKGLDIPLMLSVTVTDASGRTLSGQSLQAFLISISHAHNLLSVGLNCSFGADKLLPSLEELSSYSDKYISVHPNAGLPNGFGGYDQTPEQMVEAMEPYFARELVNIVGGCCGTTPEHILQIAARAASAKPRVAVPKEPVTTLAGLEPLHLTAELNFVNIGERANVAGSAKFARLIREENYGEAIDIVRKQVEDGAQVIDICMDAAMIDAKVQMGRFLRILSGEPDITRVPLMVDSSDWDVIVEGLKNIQGKAIVNSISLKEGEDDFTNKALTIKNFGAAVVVMLFDEKGQADSYERKIEIAERSYKILTKAGFAAHDIIFDPNVLTIATGISEHDGYGASFIDATKWIKQNLQGAKVSGGVSNLSFSFRGNNAIREAMHSVFLFHAKEAGMDMAIVNAGMLLPYDSIDARLREVLEDVVLNRSPQACEQLIEMASSFVEQKQTSQTVDNRSSMTTSQRVIHALVSGNTLGIQDDVLELYHSLGSPLAVIEDVLMAGMNRVGELFGQGKMFLPQVVKSARVMKQAVAVLEPFLQSEDGKQSQQKRVAIATVKGDVHDIGKNIVAIVLTCNGFAVEDLGVMVPTQTVIEAAKGVDALLLSGLITPSLSEMATVITQAQNQGLSIPILVGGATTSDLHTAVKLAPLYDGMVIRCKDASDTTTLLSALLGSGQQELRQKIDAKYETLRQEHASKTNLTLEQARAQAPKLCFDNIVPPSKLGEHIINIDPQQVHELINWTMFFAAWQLPGRYPQILGDPQKGEQARELYSNAQKILAQIAQRAHIKAAVAIYKASSHNETINIDCGTKGMHTITANRKLESASLNLSCADFVAPQGCGKDDYVGMFALTVQGGEQIEQEYKAQGDDYSAIMTRLLCDRLAEATSEYLHYVVRTQIWAYSKDEKFDPTTLLKGDFVGIRPAFGYSALADHAQKATIATILDIEQKLGITLTESYAMQPQSSICGLYFAHKEARYF